MTKTTRLGAVLAALALASGSAAAEPASASPSGSGERFELRPVKRAYISQSRSAYTRGRGLSEQERAALLRGEVVMRPMEFARGQGRYIGGVSYQLIRATPFEVLGTLHSVETLPHALPYTKNARFVDGDYALQRVELTQGNAVLEGRYTLVVQRRAEEPVLQFWLDPERHHDVRDLWGYFRAEPFGSDYTLVTVGVALDLGPGIVRMLFEDKIKRAILKMPRKLRQYVEPRALAAKQSG